MDYEKAFDRAKSAYGTGAYDDLTLEFIFPDLRESEDERIRKWIHKYIAVRLDDAGEFIGEYREALAWLEKQKYDRMKPIYDAKESFESALEKAWNDYHNGYENVDKLEDDYVECAHAKGFREGYLFGLQKQKEQKPVEIHIDNPNVQKFDPDVKITTSDSSASGKELLYVCNKSYKIGYRDGVASVKPAEWSEEDTLMLTAIIQTLERFGGRGTTGMQIDWLKSLRPVKQGWSEEDENMLEIVIDNYEYMFDKLRIGDDSDGIPDHILIMDWLKSLPMRCPKSSDNWKPSEEQMKALDKAIPVCIGVVGRDEVAPLESLYEQLKKL